MSTTYTKYHHNVCRLWCMALCVLLVLVLDGHQLTGLSLVSAFSLLPVSRTSSEFRKIGNLHASRKNSNNAEDDVNDDDDNMINPVTKASWYAVELFGKIFGGPSDNQPTLMDDAPISYSGPPQSIKETLERIKLDNDRFYFLSGQVDEEIYSPDCIFRDPFVSFEGRNRFVNNLANLGSFITKYDAKVLEYNQANETTIQTKIMVKLELNLPWKPVLAWPWGVTYIVDPETYCVIDHEESWDIEAWEGVKQIFRKPTLKI